MTPWPTLAAHHHGLTPEAFLARYEAAVDPGDVVTIDVDHLAQLVAEAKGRRDTLVEHWPVSA
jgi:hypothetical protein